MSFTHNVSLLSLVTEHPTVDTIRDSLRTFATELPDRLGSTVELEPPTVSVYWVNGDQPKLVAEVELDVSPLTILSAYEIYTLWASYSGYPQLPSDADTSDGTIVVPITILLPEEDTQIG